MAKSKKIDLKKVILSVNSNNILTIKGFKDEEIPFENLSDELKEMIALQKPLNIKISKAGKGGAGRKPTYKYQCPKCEKKISSSEEDLHIICKDCGIEFEQQ